MIDHRQNHKLDIEKAGSVAPVLVMALDAPPSLLRPYEFCGEDAYSIIESKAAGFAWPNGEPVIYEIFEALVRPKCGHLTCQNIEPYKMSLN